MLALSLNRKLHQSMEAIITIVGFLGAGKTTLLKKLIETYAKQGWSPFVVLNDYENASLDAEQFYNDIDSKYIKALSGSCICCSGINELRDFVNDIPERLNGITIIEANGTSDACSLMGFLGVGLNERFLPPVQVSVVDVKNWQKRAAHNDLEASQIQVSSLIVLTHLDKVDESRKNTVLQELKIINTNAQFVTLEEIDIVLLPTLKPSNNEIDQLDHLKAHWSSCSVDLPKLPSFLAIKEIVDRIPKSILRVKGFTSINENEHLVYFERTADGEVYVRPYRGNPMTGPKLLTVGPGSEPNVLEKIVQEGIKSAITKTNC